MCLLVSWLINTEEAAHHGVSGIEETGETGSGGDGDGGQRGPASEEEREDDETDHVGAGPSLHQGRWGPLLCRGTGLIWKLVWERHSYLSIIMSVGVFVDERN